MIMQLLMLVEKLEKRLDKADIEGDLVAWMLSGGIAFFVVGWLMCWW